MTELEGLVFGAPIQTAWIGTSGAVKCAPVRKPYD